MTAGQPMKNLLSVNEKKKVDMLLSDLEHVLTLTFTPVMLLFKKKKAF